jgi:uncharacterized membrane protein
MLRSILIAALAGSRSMTPLAAVALTRGATGAGLMALGALGELVGDKWRKAPDRIVPAGLAARVVTGAVVARALAPRSRRNAATVLGAAVAVGSAYVTWNARIRAQRRFGQVRTGLVEDAAVLAGTAAVMDARNRPPADQARTAPALNRASK